MYQLYYSPGSAALTPHMVLEEIGAPYKLVPVDRANKAHKGAAYLRLNPHGRVPTLVDGDLVIYETAAICMHLVDRHPEAGLAPPLGTPERAHFYKWMAYLTNTIQAEALTYFYPDRLTDTEEQAAVVKRHAGRRMTEMFETVNGAMEGVANPYLLGEKISAADFFLLMLARWTRFLDKPAVSFTQVGKLLDTLATRPSVKRAFSAELIEPPYY